MWMHLPPISMFLVGEKAIRDRWSHLRAADAFSKAFTSLSNVFLLSMSYDTWINSTALFWLQMTKSTSLERGVSL